MLLLHEALNISASGEHAYTLSACYSCFPVSFLHNRPVTHIAVYSIMWHGV